MARIKGIKVGITDIISTYSDETSQSDSKQLEVVAVAFQDVSGAISTPENTVYTGSPITPTPTVTVTLDGVVTTLELGSDYTLSYSNNTNAGQATVTATGTGNYTGTLSSNWTITGATLTVVANDQSYIYDGNLHGSSVTATSVNNQPVTIKYGLTEGTYNLDSAPQIRNVGEISSGIVYFQVTAPNHITYTGSYQLVITPIVANLTWGVTSWTYDGLAHSTTCVVSNLLSGDTCDVILSGNSITNIGSTTVTATGLTNSNYTLTGASDTTMTITIDPGLFVKLSGTWTVVKSVWKKISGEWVEQDMNSAFSTSERYKKMN